MYPVGKVCKILKIAHSTYYYQRRHGGRREVIKAEESRAVIDKFIEHHGSFGRRVLKRELSKDGIVISERKIARILKENGYRSKYGRKKCKNVHTAECTEKYIQANLFAKLTPQERQEKEIWSMDFTEQKIHGKKIYTCGIISVNRKILVGYAQSTVCRTPLAIEAIENAIRSYGRPDMIMTDRGTQFTSRDFYDMMQREEIQHSMSRPHTPIDNRFIETFWKSMKVEIGKTDQLTVETYRMVVEYYVYYYNNLRPHSALNYRTPLQSLAA